MTWSRTVSSAAMVRAAGAGTRRRVRAGLSTSWLPRSLRRSYARLADGVFGVGCAGDRGDLRGEVAHGEAVRCRARASTPESASGIGCLCGSTPPTWVAPSRDPGG
jgi:hypothetical protein